MGLFNFLRPTPDKFLLKLLPLYLEETERPVMRQRVNCILGSELTKGYALCRQIVGLRSITTGCIKSAFHIANNLTDTAYTLGESEFSELTAKMEDMTIDSTNPELSATICKFKIDYVGEVQEVTQKCIELTYDYIIRGDNVDAWKEGVSICYKEILVHGANPEKVNHSTARSYSDSFAEQHGEIVMLLVKELLDLMRAKAG